LLPIVKTKVFLSQPKSFVAVLNFINKFCISNSKFFGLLKVFK
jgi:hypothetical protein